MRGRVMPAVLGCLVIAVVSASAQPVSGAHGLITGRIVDARSGEGLARVLVQVEDGGPSATTSEDGSFELPDVSVGTRRLFIAAVGYILVRREVEVVPGRTTEITVPLPEGTGTYAETVSVTADRFRPAEPAVAAQQTLGSLEIQNLRGVLADDPLRAVQALPGVATGDDLRSEFSVRGSGFSRINLTVDGFSTPFLLHTVRAVEDYSASGSVAMINSDILEDVTLLNGAYPQRFGNRTGAEVDFRLREGSRDKQQTRVGVSGTSASGVFEGPLGRARRGSWLISARQSYLQLIVERLVDEGLHFGFSDAQAKLVYDLSDVQRVEFTMLAGRSRLRGSDETFDADELFVGRNASIVNIGSWRRASPRAVLTARTLAAYNTFSNDAYSSVRLDWGHDTQIAGRADAAVALTRGFDLEAGVQAEWTDQTRSRQRFSATRGGYRTINEYAGQGARSGVYAQVRWSAGPVTLVPGARGDRWSLTGESTASPWLQAEWRLRPALALRGGAGVYRQFPDFEQVLGVFGRPEARSERAAHYDLAVEHRIGASTRWQVTVYDREEDGFLRRHAAETRLVNGRPVIGSPTAPYEGRLDGFSRGVELFLQRRSTNGLAGWLAWSYGRNRYHDRITGESFWGDLDQRHTLNVYLFYRVSDRTSASAKLRAGSNAPAPGYFAEKDDAYILSSERNALRLPTYVRLDLRANRTFTWSHHRLTLFVEVMNVFDRANVRFNPPSVNRSTGRVSRLFEPLIPIVPSAGLLVEW